MSENVDTGWDETVDLLVIGSGAGAMTAGIVAHDLGSDVLLIEKSERYGGSSAMSGGSLWIPNNHLMKEAGIEDSREESLDYLREITAGLVPIEKLEKYVDEAPQVLRYLEEKTHLRMLALPAYADYYPRAKGSRPGGRSLDPMTFDARSLGDDLLSMNEQNPQMLVMGRVFMTIDIRHPDDAVLSRMDELVRGGIAEITNAAGISHDINQIFYYAPIAFDSSCVRAVAEAASTCGYSAREIVTGAGHDACFVAHAAPTSMIFIPCIDGISHNEVEDIHPAWSTQGANVMLQAILSKAEQMAS